MDTVWVARQSAVSKADGDSAENCIVWQSVALTIVMYVDKGAREKPGMGAAGRWAARELFAVQVDGWENRNLCDVGIRKGFDKSAKKRPFQLRYGNAATRKVPIE